MNDTERLLHETAERLFADSVNKEVITEVERGTWPSDLWNAVEQAGLTQPHLLDESGGETGWHAAQVVLRSAGRHCVPLPIAETVIASWLAARAGLELPSGPATIVPAPLSPADVSGGRVTARCERVPWARHCQSAVAVIGGGERARVAVLSLAGATLERGENLALEPRDTLRWNGVPYVESNADLPADVIPLYGALVRSIQMAGALDALLAMSVQYAGERIQFGKPLATFQAIQQELAKLAGVVAEAGTAADVAARAAAEATPGFRGVLGEPGDPSFEIACAKVVAGESAESAPRIAHQVHGAIGFTYEHALHFASRRLWSWRAEFGSAGEWSRRLGREFLSRGAERVWPALTAR